MRTCRPDVSDHATATGDCPGGEMTVPLATSPSTLYFAEVERLPETAADAGYTRTHCFVTMRIHTAPWPCSSAGAVRENAEITPDSGEAGCDDGRRGLLSSLELWRFALHSDKPRARSCMSSWVGTGDQTL